MTDSIEELKKQIKEARVKEIQNISNIYTGNDSNAWFYFSFYFISATNTLIKSMEEEYLKDKEKKNFQSPIYVPLIFLFRHTLELILKFIYVSLNKEKNKENINTHDLMDIFNKINKEKFSSTENIEKYHKKHGELSKEEISKKIDLTKNHLQELSNKYWLQTDFILTISDKNSVLPSFSIFDSQNELFKYPVANKIQVVFNPLEMSNIDKDLIDSLKEDFKKLSEVLSVFSIIG